MNLHWKNVALWAAIIFTVTQVAALVASMLFGPDGFLLRSKLSFDIVVESASLFATTLFFMQVRKPLLAHAIAAFVLVYIIDAAVYWLLTKSFGEFPGIGDVSRSVISWLAAYLISLLWVRIFRRAKS